LLVIFVPNLAACLRQVETVGIDGHCPVSVADGSMNEKTRKKNVSFPITVTHSPHVFLPKVPRYPKVCCRFLGFRLPDLHLSKCGSLAFGTDAGVPGVMADGGLRQHGTDAWSQGAINGLQGGIFHGIYEPLIDVHGYMESHGIYGI